MGVGVWALLTTSACRGQPPAAVPPPSAPASARKPALRQPSGVTSGRGGPPSSRHAPPPRALSCVTRLPFQHTVTSSR